MSIDWAFIERNFAAIMAIAGVIVGSLLTFAIQRYNLSKQREWQLDNQKREWKRGQLLAIRKDVSNFIEAKMQLWLEMNRKPKGSKIPSDLAEKLTFPITRIFPSKDSEYSRLMREMTEIDPEKGVDNEYVDLPASVSKLGEKKREILEYIDKQIEATFDPKN